MSKIMPILNQLYAGKKITLQFTSVEDRESFRQALYKIKKTQDDALTAVLDEKKQILHCEQKESWVDPNGKIISDLPSSIINNAHNEDADTAEYAIENGFSYHFWTKFWMAEKKETKFEIVLIEEVEPVKESDDGRTSFKKEISESLGEVASRLSDQSSEKSSGSST